MEHIATFCRPYFPCPDCDRNGYCTLYGHNCASLRCSGKPEEYQPEEDAE